VEILEVTEVRLPAEIEAGTYFFVSEALTNAAKHAPGSRATVRVARTAHAVEIEVADDGPGGASAHPGSGLQGLEDRLAAVGGVFALSSPPGLGTVLRGSIPIA
jgi:signal transduction histidine kinase